MTDAVEEFWDRLLSRQADLIREAFATLDAEAQTAVRAHLKRMVTEDGWHPEQRISAQTALDALQTRA